MLLKNAFIAIQFLLIIAFVVGWRWLRSSSGDSQFREQERDTHRDGATEAGSRIDPKLDRLAQSRRDPKKRHAKPLQLTGIVIDGKPHEVLGVSPVATEAEINKAYRNLMKQYHPDKLGPQGSTAWKDGQAIADAIHRAKTELLRQRKASR